MLHSVNSQESLAAAAAAAASPYDVSVSAFGNADRELPYDEQQHDLSKRAVRQTTRSFAVTGYTDGRCNLARVSLTFLELALVVTLFQLFLFVWEKKGWHCVSIVVIARHERHVHQGDSLHCICVFVC